MPRPGRNQLVRNMQNGSMLMQLSLFLKHKHLMRGVQQPERDVFAAACMADILRTKAPDLALMHLTCYDSLCHEHGEDFDKLEPALRVLDDSLAALIDAAGPQAAVIVFSDHAQLPVSVSLTLNDLLVDVGLLRKESGLYRAGPSGCFIECCGGSAFLHAGSLTQGQIDDVRCLVEGSSGFNRFLSSDEMALCGRSTLPFGFCAAPGFQYTPCPHNEKAQHGYPLDYPDYKVFYSVRGPDVAPGATLQGGSLLDIAPIALRLLGAGLPPERRPSIAGLGEARREVFRAE
jgi:hypothetical protein